MKKFDTNKIVIVALLLIGVVAVAALKQTSKTTPNVTNGALCSAPISSSDKSTASTKSAALAGAVSSNKGTGIPRLLDLGSTTCIPCKMMEPILEDLKKKHAGKLQVDFINVMEDRSASQKYGIEAIPTQILFDANGKEIYRHTGFYAKEDLLAKFNELGIKL